VDLNKARIEAIEEETEALKVAAKEMKKFADVLSESDLTNIENEYKQKEYQKLIDKGDLSGYQKLGVLYQEQIDEILNDMDEY